jgi:hypothetical protein
MCINVHRLTLARVFFFRSIFPRRALIRRVRAGRPVFNHFTPPLAVKHNESGAPRLFFHQWRLLFCSLSLASKRAWKNELFSVADFANPTPALQFIFALANWRALLLRFALQILIEMYARARARAAGACRL